MPSHEFDLVPSARSLASKETPLIDRIQEMGLLKESVEAAVRGEGCAVFLYGEAGIGKTRLTRELRAYARSRGMQILYGRCPSLFNVDSIPPYVLWKEVIRDYLQICTPEQLQSMVGDYPSEICKIVPETRQKLGGFPVSPPLSPEQERDRLFEAVSQFVENVSRTAPLVVFLDDLQWCDSSSLSLLHYLARGIYRQSLLLLGTYRDAEVEEKHPLFPVLTDLKRTQLLRSVRLKRLSVDEVSEMIIQVLGQDDVPREFCKLVHEKTQGNPYFVEEVIQSLKEEGVIYPYGVEYRFRQVSEIEFPETVKTTLQARLARLDDETRQVLIMASFIGKDFTFRALCNVTGLEENKLLEIIERMTEKKLLKCRVVHGEDACTFSDSLVRDVLYESVGPLRRRKLHGIVGGALEKAYEKDMDEHLGELAAHFLEGGDKQKALDYFLKAGEKAEQVYANDETVSYYSSALELLRGKEGNVKELARVLEVLGDTLSLIGEYDRSLKLFGEGLLLQQQLGEKKSTARLYGKTAHIWVQKGEIVKAKEHMEKAQEILEALPESVELANLYLGMADMFWRQMEPPKAVALAERALELAKKLNAPQTLAHAYAELGSIVLMNSREKAVEYYQEALRVALENRDVKTTVSGYMMLSNPHMGIRDPQTRLEYAQKGYELAKKVGAISAQSFIGLGLSGIYLNMGNIDKAFQFGEESLALNRKSGHMHFSTLSLFSLADAYRVIGEWDKSEKLFNESLVLAQKMNDVQATCYASAGIGLLFLEKGEFSKAKEYFERSYGLSEKAGARSYQASYLSHVVRANLEMGELEKAETQLNNLQQMAEEIEGKGIVGPMLVLRGRLLLAQKKYDESIKYFETALKRLESGGARRWRVYIVAKFLFEYARAYLGRNQEGDKRKAQNLLNQAFEMFQKMRARKDIERTEAVLLSIETGRPVSWELKPVGLVDTGYAALDRLLYGGIHSNLAVALTSPPFEERNSLMKSFLETGARKGDPTFCLTIDQGSASLLAEEVPASFYLFVCNPQAETLVKSAPNVFKLKGVENLTNINIALTQAMRKVDLASRSPRRICIDLISDVLLQHGPVQTRKWLTELIAQLKSAGFTVLSVIDPMMHQPEQLQAILGLFDGEVNIREAETDKGSARFLRVKRMGGQKHLRDEMLLTDD